MSQNSNPGDPFRDWACPHRLGKSYEYESEVAPRTDGSLPKQAPPPKPSRWKSIRSIALVSAVCALAMVVLAPRSTTSAILEMVR